jgi:hypothetical protein
VLTVLSALFLATQLSALDRRPRRAMSDSAGPIMEARVFFDDVRTLWQLGDLAGQLDICTRVKDELGGYLVINTDATQLEQIREAGLLVDVTYKDIRQKFYQMTGVRPGDVDATWDFGYYLTYYEMQDTLQALAAAYPTICTRFSLGLTPQGRSLWCLKISDNVGMDEGEPACFFNGATHAREPLGTNCCVAFATRILSEYGSDSVSTWLIDNREILIAPVMNPDGYVYNSDSGGCESNWRKNRRSPMPPDIGVDLNRNYGYKWGYSNWGSSFRPQDETYRGPSPFSEPETQIIRDFLAEYEPHNCMDFHSFGRYNMYPWGYAKVRPPDQAMLEEVVDTFQSNNHYPISHTGQVYAAIYACNGISVDWEYSDTTGKFVTYAFICELGINDFWYGWVDSSYINNECNLNVPNLYYLTRVAGVYFEGLSATVDDSATGNCNGQLDPGELSGVWFTVRNQAIHPLDSGYAVTARLVSGDARVQVLDSSLSFPNVSRASSADNNATQFQVRASDTIDPGTPVPLRLEMTFTDADHVYTQPVDFKIVIGDNPVAVTGVLIDRRRGRRTPSQRQPVAASTPPLYPSRLTATPNPAGDRVNFSTAPVTAAGRLDIFSPDGSRVSARHVSGPYTWDCSRVPAGIYFCRLAAAGNSVTTRVSIVH